MPDYAQTATGRVITRNRLMLFFSTIAASLSSTRNSFSGVTRSLFNRKKIGTALFILIIITAITAGIRIVILRLTPSTTQGIPAADVITFPIEREFSFQVYDKDKQLSDPVRYVMTSAQLTKQIIIKGQKANAVAGRIFLIINLKLVNDYDKSLFLNTRNYVRVQPMSTEDKLAPEIHNDTVEVQPLSTKLTRIGLPVDEKNKEFTIFVGELEGGKEAITVRFP